jgi:hypothetical protein
VTIDGTLTFTFATNFFNQNVGDYEVLVYNPVGAKQSFVRNINAPSANVQLSFSPVVLGTYTVALRTSPNFGSGSKQVITAISVCGSTVLNPSSPIQYAGFPSLRHDQQAYLFYVASDQVLP